MLFWEFSLWMTGSTFPNGTSVGREPAQEEGLATLWASLSISIAGLTSLSWIGCLKPWEWPRLRSSTMLALTLLLFSEFTFWGTIPITYISIHLDFDWAFKFWVVFLSSTWIWKCENFLPTVSLAMKFQSLFLLFLSICKVIPLLSLGWNHLSFWLLWLVWIEFLKLGLENLCSQFRCD